jgi:gamma-glutamylcyclotransferase (GGCT)/AIG2-like uncharacterized protein YtfP
MAAKIEIQCQYLFVYGTLKSGSNHPMHDWLAENSIFITKGYFQGKKFMYRSYPSVIPSTNEADKVDGEIYEIKKEAMWRKLDFYEGTDYIRMIVDIQTENLGILQCYIYMHAKY